MPRTVDEILKHADELAARFENYEPSPDDELDSRAITLLRTAVQERSTAEQHLLEAVRAARESGMSRQTIYRHFQAKEELVAAVSVMKAEAVTDLVLERIAAERDSLGKLVLQRCADCGRPRHYPRPVCDSCFSMNAEWFEASGKGAVHSWTITHYAFHPGFKGDLPYLLLTVDLDEGERMQCQARGIAHDAVSVGMRASLRFTSTPLRVMKEPVLPFPPNMKV